MQKLNNLELLSACNDASVKISIVDSMKTKWEYKFNEPVNFATISPDRNLIASCGDEIPISIIDMRTSKVAL